MILGTLYPVVHPTKLQVISKPGSWSSRAVWRSVSLCSSYTPITMQTTLPLYDMVLLFMPALTLSSTVDFIVNVWFTSWLLFPHPYTPSSL